MGSRARSSGASGETAKTEISWRRRLSAAATGESRGWPGEAGGIAGVRQPKRNRNQAINNGGNKPAAKYEMKICGRRKRRKWRSNNGEEKSWRNQRVASAVKK
jgi:hypothetical protein